MTPAQVGDLIKTLSEHVFYEVKSRSKPYRSDVKWFSYVLYDEAPFDNTPESFPMFQVRQNFYLGRFEGARWHRVTHTVFYALNLTTITK